MDMGSYIYSSAEEMGYFLRIVAFGYKRGLAYESFFYYSYL